ncbi:MAG: hypothetical protein ACOYL1_03315 [Chlamydiia bacterium]
MHTVSNFLAPVEDPTHHPSYIHYRNRVLDGETDQLRKLFEIIAYTGTSIPSVLEKDHVLYDEIQNRMGSRWVCLATESSIASQMTKDFSVPVWKNRKFELLKMDLEDDQWEFFSSLEAYLEDEGIEGLIKVFQDPQLKSFLANHPQEWILSVYKMFPEAKETIEENFHISLNIEAIKSHEWRQALEGLYENLLQNPENTASILRSFLRQTGEGGLENLFLEKPIQDLLFQNEEVFWIPEVLKEFPQAWEKIEAQISKIWLTNPDLLQFLERDSDWFKALKKGAFTTTPLLFLSDYAKKGKISYQKLDPEVLHKIFLQEAYHPILHSDKHYPWIPFYLYHLPENVQLVEAFIAKKWKDDPAFFEVVRESNLWLEALVKTLRQSREPSAFLFFVDLIRLSCDLKGLSPEKTRHFLLYLPDWILAKFGKAPFYKDKNDSFREVIKDLCEKTTQRTLEEKALSIEWCRLVKNLHPIALIELSKMVPAHQLASRWIPSMELHQLLLLIPLLELAPFKTVFNELFLEEHPRALMFATEMQKEFYANVFAYAFDQDFQNTFPRQEQTIEALNGFLLRKRTALKSIQALYRKKPQNIAQCLSLLEGKLEQIERGVSPLFLQEIRLEELVQEWKNTSLSESQKVSFEVPLKPVDSTRPLELENVSSTESEHPEGHFFSSKETVILPKVSIPRLPLERLERDS